MSGSQFPAEDDEAGQSGGAGVADLPLAFVLTAAGLLSCASSSSFGDAVFSYKARRGVWLN